MIKESSHQEEETILDVYTLITVLQNTWNKNYSIERYTDKISVIAGDFNNSLSVIHRTKNPTVSVGM